VGGGQRLPPSRGGCERMLELRQLPEAAATDAEKSDEDPVSGGSDDSDMDAGRTTRIIHISTFVVSATLSDSLSRICLMEANRHLG
jgi:hypothetical protein